MLRFSAGLMPLSSAFLECIIKCLVGDKEETLFMKSPDTQTKVMTTSSVFNPKNNSTNILLGP